MAVFSVDHLGVVVIYVELCVVVQGKGSRSTKNTKGINRAFTTTNDMTKLLLLLQIPFALISRLN